jgi:hypothetical protein
MPSRLNSTAGIEDHKWPEASLLHFGSLAETGTRPDQISAALVNEVMGVSSILRLGPS